MEASVIKQAATVPGRATASAPYRRTDVAGAASDASQVNEQHAPGQWTLFWQAFRSHRLAFAGLCVITTMIVVCALGPLLLPSPEALDNDLLRAAPPGTNGHVLGTDTIGRDVLSRLVSAGRISLGIGFIVAFASALIGAGVGVVAGYYGGKTDGFLMWLVNVLLTIPHIPLLIALAALVANPNSRVGGLISALPEWGRIALVLALLNWLGISRVVRSQVMSLKEQEYVEAAQALGAGSRRIMLVHILPNSVSVLAVFTTLAVSSAILAESGLSVLGVGVNPPTATWGNMLTDARSVFTIVEYWWLTWLPALAIFVTVLSVNFIGDGVRDALDPKSTRR